MLLIDEVDRADDEFEAFLFELLAESAVTIPELGTRRADAAAGHRADLEPDQGPARRAQAALPVPLDRLPGRRRVAEIIRRRVPAAGEQLAGQIAAAVNRLRGLDLTKPPGISEAISWAFALSVFGADELAGRWPTRP